MRGLALPFIVLVYWTKLSSKKLTYITTSVIMDLLIHLKVISNVLYQYALFPFLLRGLTTMTSLQDLPQVSVSKSQ